MAKESQNLRGEEPKLTPKSPVMGDGASCVGVVFVAQFTSEASKTTILCPRVNGIESGKLSKRFTSFNVHLQPNV